MSDVRGNGSTVSYAAKGPRVVRWAAAVALAAAVLGFTLYVGGNERWPGMMVAAAAAVAAVMALIDLYCAPVQENARGRRWRPRQVRAMLQGGWAVGALALIGLPVLTLSSDFGGWTPTTRDDWQILMLAFMTVLWTVPLAYPKFASWALEGLG